MQKKKSRKWNLSPITVVAEEIEFNFTVMGWTLHFDPDFMGPSTESNYHNLKYLCLKDFHSDIGHKPSRTWLQYVMNNIWENNYHIQTYTGREKKNFLNLIENDNWFIFQRVLILKMVYYSLFVYVKPNDTLDNKFPDEITIRWYLHRFQVYDVIKLSLFCKFLLAFIFIISDRGQNRLRMNVKQKIWITKIFGYFSLQSLPPTCKIWLIIITKHFPQLFIVSKTGMLTTQSLSV